MLGFVVIDDGRIGNVGYGFVFLVDGGVLRINVSKVGAVVNVDIAVPCVVVNSDVGLLIYNCRYGLNRHNRSNTGNIFIDARNRIIRKIPI